MPMRAGIAVLLLFAVSACEMDMGRGGAGAQPPRAVTLAQSGLTVAGPNGFCVDPGSLRVGAEGGFALLANCSGLSGRNASGLRGKTAMLTLSVSGPVAEAEAFDTPSLEAYFRSEAGRQALSRVGSAATVTLLESEAKKDILLLHARDRAPGGLPGQGEEYWRALFLLNGRLVTATAMPFAETPMPSKQLHSLLDRFITGLQRRNRGTL